MGLEAKDFPHSPQSNSTLCGPACVQMMLLFLNPGLVKNELKLTNQKQLTQNIIAKDEAVTAQVSVGFQSSESWKDATDTIWSHTPPEIKNMLFENVQLQGNKLFRLHFFSKVTADDQTVTFITEKSTQAEIDKKRNDFINHLVDACKSASNDPETGLPVIVPIDSNSHWVVLYNVEVISDEKVTFIGRDPAVLLSKKK